MLTTLGRKNGHVYVEITSLKEYTKVTGFSTFSAKKQNSAKKKNWMKSNHHIHKLMRARSLAREREREREKREREERERRERGERERERKLAW